MKKIYPVLITLLLSLPALSIFSQISQGGLPVSFQNDMSLKTGVPVRIMPPVDVKTLLKEDSLNDGNKEIPWRFGFNIFVNYDLSNSGVWDLLPNGDRLWRLGIKCPGAFSINLTFDKYCLPPGARFFEYNNDKTQVIGAFTGFNNRSDSAFANKPAKVSPL